MSILVSFFVFLLVIFILIFNCVVVKSDNNFVWLDMEMIGLSFENDCIIEVVVVVMDLELNIFVEGFVLVIY